MPIIPRAHAAQQEACPSTPEVSDHPLDGPKNLASYLDGLTAAVGAFVAALAGLDDLHELAWQVYLDHGTPLPDVVAVTLPAWDALVASGFASAVGAR